MDTKWKNRKKIISFLIFFLGVSITLGSLTNLIRHKPSGVRIWQIDKLLEKDYQQSNRFRSYIAGRLESFLIMATGGNGLGGIWGRGGDGHYYGDLFNEYGGVLYSFDLGNPSDQSTASLFSEDEELKVNDSDSGSGLSVSLADVNECLFGLEDMLEGYTNLYLNFLNNMENLKDWENQDSYTSELEEFRNTLTDCQSGFQDYLDSLSDYLNRVSYQDTETIVPLTEEQKKNLADKFHNAVKEDKNLLYTIAYEGKVLYSNTDLLPADGQLTPPEGYNFILYFDGEKVRILKDGKEINIYGDGYYRESSEWYVPGYSNFQLEDNANKATVCIAAAKEPVLYRKGSYSSDSSAQYDNTLYWLNSNLQSRRQTLLSDFIGLGAGILLLLLALLTGKARREATKDIARFQGTIWIEGKLVLFFGMIYLLCRTASSFLNGDRGYNLWQELYYDYEYNSEALSVLVQELVNALPACFWLLLFWSLWLLWNDWRHNKKLWKNSLTAKLFHTFSAKDLDHTLSRKMGRRNAVLFGASSLYGLLMLGSIIFLSVANHPYRNPVLLQILTILATVCFLILQFTADSKNTETARDLEALSCRIGEIRNGNYTAGSSGAAGDGQEETELFSGHDLETVMAQLEDIRHGMAMAVEEQMKSQRMKVELIANVSHDIKTPLTSIISYVEFLKQEENLPEHVKDYIRILDEKSQRLKNMVQDVFAVSKAASGELPIQMEALDFGKLLRQTMADMEEEINGSAVTFRTEIPETPVMIMADGQRLYRVFQNLFQNAIKYSLSGSRVYVTLRADGAMAAASVKNTSQQELEKNTDFAARFTRGDQSRTDGGSGLGLSIAQSFTEACGGLFTWKTDADLFVVEVSFRIL